jgi:hypothetical protein
MATSARSRATSLIALLSVVFLLATSCSDDGGGDSGGDESTTTTTAAADEGATTTTAPADAEPASDSPAAGLRSDLDGLLEEQVYLTGLTVEEALATPDRLDGPVAAATDQAAGESADELANLIGATYGVAGGTDFVAAWNDHRDALVEYGVANGSAQDIASTRQAVLDTLTGLDEDADFSGVESGLEQSDQALTEAIDALAAGQPAAAVDLRQAADPMRDVALDLSTAFTNRIETEGEVDGPEAEVRAELTGLLQESALLTGIGLAEAVQAGGDTSAPTPAAIFNAVADNTQAIADTLEPDDTATSSQFADLWTSHIQDFEDYATALVNDDAQGIQDAEDALVQFRDDVGELLADKYPAFTKEQVAEELVDHTDSMLAYIDASVREAGDIADDVEETNQVEDRPSEAPGLLRDAALAARLAARTLARGVTAPEGATAEEPA